MPTYQPRYEARLCLARARAQAENEETLRYAALELRYCIEHVVFDQLQSYLEEVPDEALRKWTPRDIISELLEVDPNADKSSSFSVALEATYGVPGEPFRSLGTDRRFSIKWANKTHQSLSNLLHAPTLAQLESGHHIAASGVRERLKPVIAELDDVLSSPIFGANFGNFFCFKCELCNTEFRRRSETIPSTGVTCPNRRCKAQYEITSSDSKTHTYRLKQGAFKCRCGLDTYLPGTSNRKRCAILMLTLRRQVRVWAFGISSR